jgi:hypothetical protein
MNGVTFTLTPAGQPGQTAVSGQTATNGVLWQDLPPGKTSIGQMPMSGFASRVFCDQSVPGDSGKVHYTERTIAGSVFSTKIDPGEELACDWFDLNDGGANGTGGMSLFTFACPAEFDAGNASPDDFGSNCADPLNGIGFALAAQNGNLTGNTGDYQAGVVNFYDVPQQGAVVVATPPAGYTTGAVFCGQALAYDGHPNGFDRMATYDTDAIQTEIVPGAQDVCRWFFTASNGALVFAGNQAEPDATATADDNADTGNNNGSGDDQSATDAPSDDNSDPSDAQGTTAGTVTVINHVCPSGFDAIDADINTLYQECTGDGNGFLFALTTEGVTTNQTSGDALDQSAVWTGVPAHRFTIEEGIPDGYGAGAAYCTASTGESTYYPGSAIHPDLPANAALTCDWFTAQQ